MEGRVPKPLVWAVLLESWPVEVKFHAPFLTLDKMRLQGLSDIFD